MRPCRGRQRRRLTDISGTSQERAAALSAFDREREAFEEAVRRAPDAALRHKPAGEDYALGGLVVHVADVLRHYAAVLDAMRIASEKPIDAPPHVTSDADAALIRDGFSGAARVQTIQQMRAAHAAFAEATGGNPFDRQIPVRYSTDREPRPTSPADVLGWVLDHYREHTRQVADLVSDWAAATR